MNKKLINSKGKDKFFLVFAIFTITFFCMNLISSATITIFNNSLSTENLTFTGNQNLTRYLSVPSGYLVNFSNITLRGYNNTPSSYSCFQEQTNVSTAGDGDCNLNYTGYYNYSTSGFSVSASGAFDADYDTSTYANSGWQPYIVMNYTKPINATGAKWQVKTTGGLANWTIPSGCFNAIPSRIRLVINLYSAPPYYFVYLLCYDGVSSDLGFTGFDYIGQAYSGSTRFYEEGIYWNISSLTNLTNTSLLINNNQIWFNLNQFTSSQVLTNLTNSINNYISTCTLISGNCRVPFIFHSDTAGVLNYSSMNFTTTQYILNNISYTTPVKILQPNIITGNFSFGSNPTNVKLNYNGTEYTPVITTSGINYFFNSTVTAPLFLNDTNITFYYTFTLGSTNFQTSNYTQLIEKLSIDNCSSNIYPILNLSLYDELTKTSIYGDIQINYQLINNINYENVLSLLLNLDNRTNISICSNINLSNSDFLYSAEIRYTSEGYASEFYNIQRAELESTTPLIELFDLNSSSSTEFKVTYQDSNFDFIENAIIQLQRKYISEGIYETVEAPLTSSEGITILHIDLNSNLYRATVVKNGVVLDEFDNLVFKCQSELAGECEMKLLGEINPQNDDRLDNTLDFYYSDPVLNETTNQITVSFSIPSGLPSNVNIVLEQKDQFGNKTLCNQTITSSAGSISCTYNDAFDRSYIDLSISKSNSLMAFKTYIIEAESGLDWLENNYIFMLIILLSLVGMALTSPEYMIINGIITFVVSGALYLARGLDFVAGLGIIIWLIIASIILISKISKQEDR
jgi:hypothetical protein